MSNETTQSAPVPPGWVRLTDAKYGYQYCAPASDWRYCQRPDGTVGAWLSSDSDTAWKVTESPAEVAAMIAEAQRAQRRAEALPVMAAIMRASAGVYTLNTSAPLWTQEDAIAEALEILDAIEARERSE